MSNGNKAIKYLSRSIAINNHLFKSLYYRSWVQKQMGAIDSAMNDINAAINVEPMRFEGYLLRASLWNIPIETENAIQDYSKAIDLSNATCGVAYLNRALLYVQCNQLREANADYERAQALIPRECEEHIQKMLDRRTFNFETMTLCNNILAMNPQCYGALVMRAKLFLVLLNEVECALEDCCHAVSIQRDCFEAYEVRASVYHVLKQYTKSLVDVQKVLELKPNHIKALVMRGILFKDAFHLYDSALADFRAAEAVLDGEEDQSLIQQYIQETVERAAL